MKNVVKSIATLNRQLNQLMDFQLVQYHLKQFKREEFYSITEKGKRVFSLVEQLIIEIT
jgi:DNA-binding HxlR family transcriptional regulator